jgi:shikimate dehydrogenase
MSRIDPTFQVCAIFGHPVGHSLSPAIHNAAFEALNLPFVYVAHDIEPGHVPEAMAAIRALGYRGLSVTIPHKIAALSCVDEVDATARAIGCINTVVNEKGRLFGYNSDGRGAVDALRRAGADPAGRRVVVLGTGGAARAISMTLAFEAKPAELLLLGVVPEELAQLTRDIKDRTGAPVEGRALDEKTLAGVLASADLLLQCTPIGQHPKEDQTLVPARLLRPELTVFDVVYNPRRTKLLREAAEAGCRVVEGKEMFLGQALVQFELWTGQKPPAEIMRRVIEERL